MPVLDLLRLLLPRLLKLALDVWAAITSEDPAKAAIAFQDILNIAEAIRRYRASGAMMQLPPPPAAPQPPVRPEYAQPQLQSAQIVHNPQERFVQQVFGANQGISSYQPGAPGGGNPNLQRFMQADPPGTQVLLQTQTSAVRAVPPPPSYQPPPQGQAAPAPAPNPFWSPQEPPAQIVEPAGLPAALAPPPPQPQAAPMPWLPPPVGGEGEDR